MAQVNHNIRQRYGGMTNDEYVATQAGSFFDCSNVEVRKNSAYFELSKDSGQQAATPSGAVISFYGPTAAAMSAYTDTGKILKFSDNSIVASASIQYANRRNVMWYIDQNMQEYIFIAGETAFHRYKYTPASPYTVTIEENYGVYSPDNTIVTQTKYRPMLQSKSWIYIGNKTSVLRYDIRTGAITAGVSLERTDEVRAIAEVGEQIIIFSTNGGSTKQYFWDGVSDLPNRVVTWYGEVIKNIVVLKNVVYAITQNGLHQSQGYDSPLIYRAVDRLSFNSEFTNAVETIGNIMFLPMYNKIVTYGEYIPGFGKSLVKSFSFGTGTQDTLTALAATTDGLFYAYTDGSAGYYGLKNGYAAQGYIETTPIIGDGVDFIKKIDKMQLGYELPHSSCSIEIYLNKNDKGYDTTPIKTISSANSDLGFGGSLVVEGVQWRKLQFKIVLKSTNPLYSPKVFGLLDLFTPTQDVSGR